MACSKSLQSTAMCSKLAAVGTQLDKNNNTILKGNIDGWLKDNPSIMPRLWQLMETELVWELMGDVGTKHLPKSCTRVSLLSHTMEKCLVNRGLTPCMSRELIKLMKLKDPKIVSKLFTLKYQFPKTPSYPLKAALTYEELFSVADTRDQVLGKRMANVEIGTDGSVDLDTSGVYGYAKLDEDGKGVLLPKTSSKEATHIMHKFAKILVSISDLGLPAVDESYFFIDNHDETITHLCNGRRMRIELWTDFKDNAYFKYESKFATLWGNDGWKALCGSEVGVNREKAKKDIEKNENSLKKIRDAAASMDVAPAKKRRKIN